MTRKYEHPKEGKGGWTQWIFPTKIYKFSCCDCGLVHDLKLEAVTVKNSSRGMFLITGKTSRRNIRVGMKVKRNNRATAAVRRYKETK